jgi:chemotaxis protein MotA
MDIATIVGLLGAFGLIVSAIDDLGAFIDTPSMLIVVGGSIMVVMLRSSLGEFLGAVSVLGKTFKNKLDDQGQLIEQIVELATIARKDGMIALEGQEIANPFLAKAISMLVDGTDASVIKGSLER